MDEHLDSLKLPSTLSLKSAGQVKELRGEDLHRFNHQAASELQRSLEDGKAPYLGLLNKGAIVPLVFGFEKINHLSTHPIQYLSKIKHYSYQDADHPLSGSPETGGKLKEVEVRNLGDLATLCLGCAIKGVELPTDLTVRVKGQNGKKARYLDGQQMAVFRHKLMAQIAGQAAGEPLQALGLPRLQAINSGLRATHLSEWLKV